MDCLHCDRRCSNLSNPHDNPMQDIFLTSSFSTKENWGSENLQKSDSDPESQYSSQQSAQMLTQLPFLESKLMN